MRVFAIESFWIPLFVVTVVSAVLCVPLSGRRADLRQVRQQQAELENRVRILKQENEELRAERDALLTSAAQIEKVAREEYGYRAPGENVSEFNGPEMPVPPPETRPHTDRWDWLLRSGEYPWGVPLLVFGISAVFFAAVNAASRSRAK